MISYKIFFFFAFLICVSCKSSSKKDTTIWESKYHQLSIQYYQPWKLIPVLDTKEKTQTGIIDMNDGKSYIAQLMKDVSYDSLSNDRYYEHTKSEMLKPDERNRLLSENDTLYHGKTFRQMVFMMYTKKWGLLKMVSLIRRTEIECCTVQICFPVSEDNIEKSDIPPSLQELDKHIMINGQ